MYWRKYRWILRAAVSLSLLCCLAPKARGQNAAYTDSLLAALGHAGPDAAKAGILIKLSRAYDQSIVTKEFYYASEALNLSEKAHWDEGKMYSEKLLADCYTRVTGYNDAIAHFKLSIAAAKRINRADVAATCLTAVSQIYYDLKDMDNMVLYQKESLEMSERSGVAPDICYHMNKYALRLSDAGRYQDALDYWKQNIAFAKSHLTGTEQATQLANILNTIANTYVKLRKPDSALYCLRSASALIRPTSNDFLKAYIISTFCDVYESIHEDDSAEMYGEQTVKMGEALNNIDLQHHYCETLSRVYEEDHKPAKALFYYKRTDSLTAIMNSAQKQTSQAMEVAKISIDQQAQRNKEEKKALEAIKRNQEMALIATIIALLAFIILTAFIYYNLRQKQKANKTIGLQAASLQQQNELIDKALKEKEILLQETHHRIKNNLQLISSLLELQAASLDDEDAKQALYAAQRRVLSIATVHSKLYGSNDDEAIEFAAFANDLFSRLSGAFNSEGKIVKFDNRIPPTFLPLHAVVLLGLILNELLTNSFKHAFGNLPETAIIIELTIVGGWYKLRYSDSGPGLPEGAFDEHSASLGLHLIKRLSKQLKGTVMHKFSEASTFTIIFPDADN